MAAFLYPGVKSLQLVLDRPYDTIRLTDVRDDLVAIKVWYSLTSGFNPNNAEGTLVPSGNSLNVTIPNLTPNTRYYVKYAFVSAIDEDEVDPVGPTGPGSYTVSAQLTAVVLEENISVYGYLTNDPVPIVTETDGTGGDFSQATGVFKVFNLSTEVTGAGPVYAIKPFTTDSITGATINAATGVYSCTGLTDDGGNVTFTATYNGITVEQVWNVYRALAGETAPLIQLSTPNKEFIYKDQFATSSQTPSTTVTARLVNLTGTPTFTVQAFTREGVSLGNIAFTQSTNTITITKAQFDALGITIGTAVVTATIGTVSDVITLFRINDGTEQITVYLSNESHGIPAYADGTTTPSSYVGSGTLIQVKQGNTYLPVDNNSPFADGTWTVSTITANGIVCDTTPAVGGNFIEYDRHASMDNALDVATIDYTITGKTSSGVAFSIVKRQSFAKSKEGVKGATARSVAITAPNQIFITSKNTTTPLPSSIVLTAVQSNFITPTYTWLVDGTAPSAGIGSVGVGGSTFTLNSFAAVGSKTVRVTVTETIGTETFSVFDIFSVYSLREGDDAFIGGLSNENQTISCDSAGDANAGQFPITSKFFAALGITFLSEASTPAVTFAKVSYNGGGTCTINTAANTPVAGQPAGYINIDGPLSLDSATAVFTATIYSGTANAKTITKELSLNKSKDGKIGEGITQIYIRSTDNPPATPGASAGVPSGWSATVAGATGSNPLWTSFGKREVGATIYTWQTPVRVEGQTVINPPLKNSTGYLYYDTASTTAPSPPQATSYDFATGNFSSLTAGWSTTFLVAPASTTEKMWAVRYSVQETVSGGAQTISISSVFTHQNFNGLVTFTNSTYATPATATAAANTAISNSTVIAGKVDAAGATTAANTAISNSTVIAGKVDAAGATTAANTAISNSTVIAGKANSTDVFISNTTVIDGGKIYAGSIDVNKLSIGPFSAPGTPRNSGQRVVISQNKIEVFDAAGARRIVLGDLS
jgi:hypothetical protein